MRAYSMLATFSNSGQNHAQNNGKVNGKVRGQFTGKLNEGQSDKSQGTERQASDYGKADGAALGLDKFRPC